VAQNLEIKVSCSRQEFAAIASRLRAREVVAQPPFEQVDTYFLVPHGRLKMRRITDQRGRSAELIQYRRPSVSGARTSIYNRIPFSAKQARDLISALGASLGTVAIVRKQRTVAIWQSTRIHFDDVQSLGLFVELETVIADAGSEAAGAAEFADVMDWLQIGMLESIPGSYCDLMTTVSLS
jgi:predicted adenylyl cyclase CyaB